MTQQQQQQRDSFTLRHSFRSVLLTSGLWLMTIVVGGFFVLRAFGRGGAGGGSGFGASGPAGGSPLEGVPALAIVAALAVIFLLIALAS